MKNTTKSGIVRMVRVASGMACALVLGLLPLAPAEAAVCAAGAQCEVHLTNTNVLGVSVDIQVDIDNSGVATILTFSFVSDNITNTALGIDQFGYNSTAQGVGLPGNPSWNQANNCPCQMDGFGSFASEIDDSGGTDLTFTFTLDSLVTSFAENAQGAEFAAHIRYSGGCSAFVSDGTADQPTANTACVPDIPRPVPEPATLLLLGIGLMGIGFARRVRASR